jgi:thiamine pyrophosphate-dependent acetolactate synthase large subunit-like protein
MSGRISHPQVTEVAERDAHGPDGLNPAAVALALRANLDDDATVAVDMGANFIHMPRHFRTYHPRHLLFSNEPFRVSICDSG